MDYHSNLDKKIIDATVVQQPYEYGFQAVKLLKALLGKDDATVKKMVPVGKIIDVPCRTVTSDPNGPVKSKDVWPLADLKKYLDGKGMKGT